MGVVRGKGVRDVFGRYLRFLVSLGFCLIDDVIVFYV